MPACASPASWRIRCHSLSTASSRAAATAKWGLRAGLHRLAPSVARRLFTVHYACLCLPDG